MSLAGLATLHTLTREASNLIKFDEMADREGKGQKQAGTGLTQGEND